MATQHIYNITSKAEFETIFRMYYSNLCAYANKFVYDVDTSEEIVQEVFFQLWKQREEIGISTSLKSYLYRSVRNRSLNFIKHNRIKDEYENYSKQSKNNEVASPEDEIYASELEQKIVETIDQLPPERKKIFIMSRYDGLKYKEIAEKLNISIKTVENQMGKAIKYLRENLVDYLTILIIAIIILFNK